MKQACKVRIKPSKAVYIDYMTSLTYRLYFSLRERVSFF